jgi:hypothetical protein
MKYEDAIIQTTCVHKQTGEKVVLPHPGKVAINVGLGYWIDEDTEDGKPLFTVTHLATGLAVGETEEAWETEVIAQQFLEAIAYLWNWNKPWEELKQDSRAAEVAGEIRRLYQHYVIEDAASTSMGGAA